MATRQRLVRFVRRRVTRRLSALTVLAGALALAATTVPAATAAGAATTPGGTVHASATAGADSEGIVVDGWGGLHVFTYGSTPAKITSFNGEPYWPGWDIARGVALRNPNPNTCTAFGGYVLDGWGGLQTFGINGNGAPAHPKDGPYWKGWDIARDVALLPMDPRNPDSPPKGGLVLDGWGGLHYFTINAGSPRPVLANTPYWPGWDIARGVVVVTDSNGYVGGYVIDGWGGTHPFSIDGHMAPALAPGAPYWSGWDIAEGGAPVPASIPGGIANGGFVLDGFGGLHPFTLQGRTAPDGRQIHGAPYWQGFDIARGVTIRPIRTC